MIHSQSKKLVHFLESAGCRIVIRFVAADPIAFFALQQRKSSLYVQLLYLSSSPWSATNLTVKANSTPSEFKVIDPATHSWRFSRHYASAAAVTRVFNFHGVSHQKMVPRNGATYSSSLCRCYPNVCDTRHCASRLSHGSNDSWIESRFSNNFRSLREIPFSDSHSDDIENSWFM